jgi:hypothetical protein
MNTHLNTTRLIKTLKLPLSKYAPRDRRASAFDPVAYAAALEVLG